jgi:Cell division protein FtsQ/DivIB, C-terminal
VAKRGTATRRSAKSAGADWTRRVLGLVLCAFFGLGVATGLSQPGRAFAARVRVTVDSYWAAITQTVGLWRDRPAQGTLVAPITPAGRPIALVERGDGFYALLARGELRGPIEPESEGNLPILSGPSIERARPRALVRYAATLVRAEADLAHLISEMRLGDDGTAALFFDHSHTELRLDLNDESVELRRAAEVLRRWRGHQALIASLDMTTPGQAVMRLRGVMRGALARRGDALRGDAALRRIAERDASGGALR